MVGFILGSGLAGFLFLKAPAGGCREKGLGVETSAKVTAATEVVVARMLVEPDPVGTVGAGGCGGGSGPKTDADGAGAGLGP